MAALTIDVRVRVRVDRYPSARCAYTIAWRALRVAARYSEHAGPAEPDIAARATGWDASRQMLSMHPWPAWHPLVTGRPRRMPLCREDAGSLAMEARHFARIVCCPGYHRGALP